MSRRVIAGVRSCYGTRTVPAPEGARVAIGLACEPCHHLPSRPSPRRRSRSSSPTIITSCARASPAPRGGGRLRGRRRGRGRRVRASQRPRPQARRSWSSTSTCRATSTSLDAIPHVSDGRPGPRSSSSRCRRTRRSRGRRCRPAPAATCSRTRRTPSSSRPFGVRPRGETYLAPRLGAALAATPADADRAAGRPDAARARGPAPDRARPHERRDRHQLYLSVRTVESHRAHIQQKLRRSTRAELVRYALDHDLLDD